MTPRVTIAVLAKEPVAGRSKTRLSPPFTLEEAAALADAMLQDVLHAVADTPDVRRVVVLDGAPGDLIPPGFELLAQRGTGHAERIANAFEDLGGPALLIGMDTPQVSANVLRDAIDRLNAPGTQAVLGPAADGGWWAAGFREPVGGAFEGVPMSMPDTVIHQRKRFAALGLRWTELPELVDVDDAASAAEVARQIPDSRFARLLGILSAGAAV